MLRCLYVVITLGGVCGRWIITMAGAEGSFYQGEVWFLFLPLVFPVVVSPDTTMDAGVQTAVHVPAGLSY